LLRFKALDSWRGICALAVVFFHFPITGSIREFPLFAHGYLFVDFFFVLSGFVIATAWEGRLTHGDQTWRFLLRRFGRLWPLHVTVLMAFVGVSLIEGDLNHDERHSVGAIFTNLLLVHGLGMHRDLTWNGPSWSISVEAALYVVFALLALLRWRVWAYFALIAVSLVALATWAPQGMASTFDFGIFRGLAGFFTGALLTRLPPLRLGLAGEVAVILVTGTFVWFNHFTVLAPAVFGLAVYVFAHASGPITKGLEGVVFNKLGEWSYSTYMNHAAVVAVIWKLGPMLGLKESDGMLISPSPELSAIIAVVYVLAVVAASAVTYRFLEQPGRDLFNRWASSRRSDELGRASGT
jgi:peptidoglycan/LPS O-acetylase OafA/YrhL